MIRRRTDEAPHSGRLARPRQYLHLHGQFFLSKAENYGTQYYDMMNAYRDVF